MELRSLGSGAADVTCVGFGGMPLSTSGRPEEADSVRVLHAALDAGMTLIDTADVYCLDDRDIGHTERLIARALREWPGARDRIQVATKGGMIRPGGRWERDARPESLKAACDASLAALGVETIDLYQLHAPDPAVPLEDSVGALSDLSAEGKIRAVGLSNVSVDEIRRAEAVVPITTVQNRLNPFFREAIREGVVEYTSGHGIGFLAYSPVGGGRLNRKLPDHPVVSSIARDRGASPHAVVIAWVLSLAPNVLVIPGARSIDHALDSIAAADLELSAEEAESIETATFSTA